MHAYFLIIRYQYVVYRPIPGYGDPPGSYSSDLLWPHSARCCTKASADDYTLDEKPTTGCTLYTLGKCGILYFIDQANLTVWEVKRFSALCLAHSRIF